MTPSSSIGSAMHCVRICGSALTVRMLSGGDLIIEGGADVAGKGRMLRKSAEAIEGRFIVDRLHVRPETPMEDGVIR